MRRIFRPLEKPEAQSDKRSQKNFRETNKLVASSVQFAERERERERERETHTHRERDRERNIGKNKDKQQMKNVDQRNNYL